MTEQQAINLAKQALDNVRKANKKLTDIFENLVKKEGEQHGSRHT